MSTMQAMYQLNSSSNGPEPSNLGSLTIESAESDDDAIGSVTDLNRREWLTTVTAGGVALGLAGGSEAKERDPNKPAVAVEYAGTGGKHLPVQIQTNVGRKEKNRPQRIINVKPGKDGQTFELDLPPGRHTLDIRPMTVPGKNSSLIFVDYDQKTKVGNFFTYILVQGNKRTRMASGMVLDVKKNEKVTVEIEPMISFSPKDTKPANIKGGRGGCYVSNEEVSLPAPEKPKTTTGSLRIQDEKGAINYPYKVEVCKWDNGTLTLVDTIYSTKDGKAPKLKEAQSSLEPGKYVFRVTAMKNLFDQTSLVTLKSGNNEKATRQVPLFGAPIEVKPGQEVDITVEQHIMPYNTTVGEFRFDPKKPGVRTIMTFNRGYPSMGDINMRRFTVDDARNKSELLDIHVMGKEKFVARLAAYMAASLMKPKESNRTLWRQNVMINVIPEANGHLNDNLRGCSVEELGKMSNEQKSAHEEKLTKKLIAFLTPLLEQNLEQPYRAVNAAGLHNIARRDLRDNTIQPRLEHINKREAMALYAGRYIEQLKKNKKD